MTEQDKLLVRIAEDLAKNTQATIGMEKHLGNLNGKVAEHESRIRTLDSAVALSTQAIKQLQGTEDEKSGIWKEWRDRILWAAFCIFCLIAYKILVINGLIADFLK